MAGWRISTGPSGGAGPRLLQLAQAKRRLLRALTLPRGTIDLTADNPPHADNRQQTAVYAALASRKHRPREMLRSRACRRVGQCHLHPRRAGVRIIPAAQPTRSPLTGPRDGPGPAEPSAPMAVVPRQGRACHVVQHPPSPAAPPGARARRRRPAGREPAGDRPPEQRHDAHRRHGRRTDLRSAARHRPRLRLRPRCRHVDEDPGRLARRRRRQDRDRAVPAAADEGRRRRRAAVQRARHAGLPDHDPRHARAGLLQPGAAAGVRLQPRRGAARLPGRAKARSDLRGLLLGRGADPRAQHQRADDAGGERAGARRARRRRWRSRPAPAPRSAR